MTVCVIMLMGQERQRQGCGFRNLPLKFLRMECRRADSGQLSWAAPGTGIGGLMLTTQSVNAPQSVKKLDRILKMVRPPWHPHLLPPLGMRTVPSGLRGPHRGTAQLGRNGGEDTVSWAAGEGRGRTHVGDDTEGSTAGE